MASASDDVVAAEQAEAIPHASAAASAATAAEPSPGTLGKAQADPSAAAVANGNGVASGPREAAVAEAKSDGLAVADPKREGGTAEEGEEAAAVEASQQRRVPRGKLLRRILQKRRLSSSSRKVPVDTFNIKLEKLQGLAHGDDASLLSLDFASSAGRQRLATSGQDGIVKVWAIQQEAPRCRWLATLKEHMAPANCVRWSPDCQLLASCDADAVLIVWAPGLGAAHAALRAGASKAGPEPWHRKWLLRGHGAEICDLAWHPGGRPGCALASCSHDGTVRLWDVQRGQATARLDAPASCLLVKGVSFDPLGQFLAAMSDTPGASNHPRAFLWESPDEEMEPPSGDPAQGWTLVRVNEAPWANPAPLGTAVYFRRPSWDPLGQLLCFPYGEKMRCEISTPRYFAALYRRGLWDEQKLYRGHTQRVSIVRFAPLVFGPPGDAGKAAVVFAMGSQDGIMSIWMSCYPAPIAVLEDLVDENCIITDVSWSQDGSALAFASNDGSVGVAEFTWAGLRGKGGLWSPQDIVRWRRQRHLEVTQPLWDLPSIAQQVDTESTSAALAAGGAPPQKRERDRGQTKRAPEELQRAVRPRPDLRCGHAESRWPPRSGPPWLGFDAWFTPACGPWDAPPAWPARPVAAGAWRAVGEAGQVELLIEPLAVVPPCSDIATSIRLVDRRPAASTGGGGRGGGAFVRWRTVVDGYVRLACLRSGAAALALTADAPAPAGGSAGGAGRAEGRVSLAGDRLLLLEGASGRPLLPPLLLQARTVAMHLAEDCSALLLLDAAGRVSWWALTGKDAPYRAAEVAAPASFLTTSGSALQPELGFLPDGLPCLRAAPQAAAGGEVPPMALHPGLQAWVALDVWRYSDSPLQCHAPLPCPKFGPLSELLWRWRRPSLPSAWSIAGEPHAEDAVYSAHAARRSQLDHDLALRLAFGGGAAAAESASALRDVVAYCAEAGNSSVISEITSALMLALDGGSTGENGGGPHPAAAAAPAAAAPARLLARGLAARGVNVAGLRAEVEPLLRGTGSA